MLFSYLFSKKVNPKKPGLNDSGSGDSFTNVLLTYVFWIMALAITLGAVMLSMKCNYGGDTTKTIVIAILAALFPEVYLVYFALRKYIFKDTTFCPNL